MQDVVQVVVAVDLIIVDAVTYVVLGTNLCDIETMEHAVMTMDLTAVDVTL